MEFCRAGAGSGTLIAPVADFLETLATGLFEQANTVTDVLKFMDIGPDLSLPVFLMNRSFSAGGAASVQLADNGAGGHMVSVGQFDEDAANFLDVFVGVDNVLVAQEKAKSQLAGFGFGLGAGLKGSVFGSELLDGVTRHPEAFFGGHLSITSNRDGRGGRHCRTWVAPGAVQLGCRGLSVKCL